MSTFYSYLYRDPSRGGEPIYVGKGKGRRVVRHLSRTDMHPFVQRLQKMRKDGVEPHIEFLCRDVDEELAMLVEMEAIDKYGRKDLGKGSLLNLTDGGDGTSGHIPSAETVAKRSASLTGKKRTDEQRAAMCGPKEYSDVGKEAMRLAGLNSTKTEDGRKRIREANRTRVISEATREKHRLAALNMSNERREKLRAAAKRYWAAKKGQEAK